MGIILFENSSWEKLLPLTFTKPVAELRLGILTISEKWKLTSGNEISFLTQDYLNKKFPLRSVDDCLYIAGNVLPTSELWAAISSLREGEALYSGDQLLAFRSKHKISLHDIQELELSKRIFDGQPDLIERPWDLFNKNAAQIIADIQLLGLSKNADVIASNNTLIGDNIYVEEGARVTAAIINSSEGPVFIAKDAEIMEGAIVRGPFALCHNSTIKMGAKMYSNTTIGPHCKIGGEVANIVVQAYSNKGHDGYLGNSVIGEWCNLGADSNSSNLKNNYSKINVWSYETETMISSGQQFCGLIMGDHSKTGINTMLNTGTVTGVCANIFGGDFPPKFIPSFFWGGARGFETFRLDKAYEVANKMMQRRGLALDELDKEILKEVFNRDAKYRS